MGPKQVYISCYNLFMTLAWSYAVVHTSYLYCKGESLPTIWKAVGRYTTILQTLELVELLHSIFKIVPAPVMSTATQLAGRLWILWGIMHVVPEVNTTQSVTLAKLANYSLQLNFVTLFISWGLGDIIRFVFYLAKDAGYVPFPLLWLRYSAFLVLYPIGVASEWANVFLAYPTIKEQNLLSIRLPNWFNFSFYYWMFIKVSAIPYMYLFGQLFYYMLRQRSKALSRKSVKKQN